MAREARDVRLYGHPSGRKFQSHSEFLPHLLWMMSDIDHNWTNCACGLCGPNIRYHGISLNRKAKLTGNFSKLKVPEVRARARQLIAEEERTSDQQVGSGWFRKGELLWHHANIRNVRLWTPALVIDKPEHDEELLEDSLLSAKGYLIYLLEFRRPVGRVKESDLRPWLAMPTKCSKPQPLNIANSWGVFDKLNLPHTMDGFQYNGLWFGPEKIWRGDAIRIRSDSCDEEVLVIEAITCNNNVLMLTGDIFAPKTASVQPRVAPPRLQTLKNWALVNQPDEEVSIELSEVYGRWYSNTLCPIAALENLERPQRKTKSRREAVGVPAIPILRSVS